MTRDEIIRALEGCIESDREWKCPEDCPYIDKRKVLDDEDDCATLLKIDAIALLKEEPKRGRWVLHPIEPDWRVCSSCGTGTEIVRHEYGAETKYYFKFCPWCGAKMEGEDNDR